jgi:hypothetical protein
VDHCRWCCTADPVGHEVDGAPVCQRDHGCQVGEPAIDRGPARACIGARGGQCALDVLLERSREPGRRGGDLRQQRPAARRRVRPVLVAQSPWLAGRDARRGPTGAALLAAVDTVLVLWVAVNSILVGAAVGAYGSRMIAAVLPHGPLELIAFALALALHLRARRGPLGARHILTTAAACLAVLALAAVLETFTPL